MRDCSTCKYNPVCLARIEMARIVQRFKWFAMTPKEVENTTAETTTGSIYSAIAAACTQWEETKEIKNERRSEGTDFC